MEPSEHAERLAEIARHYAFRRRYHIGHTGHTVHRLLDAVSALIGQRVTLEPPRVPPPAPNDAGADTPYAAL